MEEKYFKKLDIRLVKGEYKNPVQGKLVKPEQIYKVFESLKDKNQETLVGVFVDDDLEVRTYDVLSLGTEDEAVISTKDIFAHALILKSDYFILIHNHPKGDPSPSESDVHFMELLKEYSKKLQINLLDFIIVGDKDMNKDGKKYWSMFEEESGGEYSLGKVF